MKAITHLLEESVNKFTNNPYLCEKKDGEFLALSYSDTRKKVHQFAAGLMSMNIQKGDCIALLSEGRTNWVIAELGILYAGAINVPLSVKLTEPSDIKFRLEHSGAKMIVISKSQLKKIKSIRAELPLLEKIIILDSLENYNDREVFFEDIVSAGIEYINKYESDFNKRWQSISGNDYANICYTSGTTADPKGIILTHRNYTANTEQALSLIDVPTTYTTLLILPWDHAFAHSCGIFTMMQAGASIASIEIGSTPMETLKNIPINIKDIRPHFLMSVPALSKNFKKSIEAGIRSKGKITEMLFKLALNTAFAYNGDGFNKGKSWRILLKPFHNFFDKILFSKIRDNFGGRLKFFIGGGALLDTDLQRFFYAIGTPIFQGYGLTEASPVISANSDKVHKIGSSGLIVRNLDIKICDDKGLELPIGVKGEIVVRGENVMAGYWKNPEATAQTIINNWLHTGDMGYIDKDGFLYVLGRFKSLLIGDDGEKYSPEGIEEALTDHLKVIDQVMLYNNQNPYTVVLLYPNKEVIKRWLKTKHPHATDDESIRFILKEIESEIAEYRTHGKHQNMFPQRWLPVAIGIIDEGFTEENTLLNSTLKMVRGKIIEKYSDRIAYLYTSEAKNIFNSKNIDAMKKILK